MAKILLALLAAILLAGCSEPVQKVQQPVSTPPSTPTDQFQYDDLIVGTVNRGGSGPCYGLVTDDGRQFALYENQGRELIKGVRVQVRAEPSTLRIDCGPGELLQVNALDEMR
ncbi:hypothetical protein [Actinoplanes friuliensis]|jgi:hypothetical protein|uniref:Uncharacterized protein n=1 Tax=Actinoplanes friuliensis DSM 7358 TaxID=1246995 RepID=U5VSG3_9ACTN|nr:hypothetical protein [Actinoplanes friuliensis]AGZ38650.1 hypothetical protein AFR_01805 [Actinoplanes friuliensis DSM 7358]